MNKVVSNTGPLLHLAQIGKIALFEHMESIVIAPTVEKELIYHFP